MTTEASDTIYSLFPLDSIEGGTPEVAQAAWAMLQVCSHGLCLAVLARVPPAVHFVALVAKLCFHQQGNPGKKAYSMAI